MSPNVPEHTETLNETGQEIADLIQRIMKTDNINLNRIIIGMHSFEIYQNLFWALIYN